ncbi:S-adenosylmethionine decarboxylase proenzyme 4-like [Rhodamnia argentea]|uniref:S-adenosylmethionine decarboxylase proenzyme n=1 Tax=Rhodamnia argentea TaxID=178133 RepID=A0ABM3GZ54_9MYRT|nr:S-adenosylmethionine decarboxylase proenzyme 4-like [Rhodamnia argentea]
MAASGFEGFEKRLELHFSGDDPAAVRMGLRRIEFESLERVLGEVQCTVVSALGNAHLDAYVLSESSLFVYPTKIVIKTCGTTQLLRAVRPLVVHARGLGLALCLCRYTRGSFIFPLAQPFPHTSFPEEVAYLEGCLPTNICSRKAAIMPSNVAASHSWHVFTAYDPALAADVLPAPDGVYTVEVCMTELDRGRAQKFFRQPGDGKTGDSAGKEMTALTGIGEINPRALVCDFAFDPCGYSMNGVDGGRYSTIHVTPEEGFSYASYECVGSADDDDGGEGIARMLRKVAGVFRPGTMSVSVTSRGSQVWTRVASALEPLGLKCRSCAATDQSPEAGTVVFQTFTARPA